MFTQFAEDKPQTIAEAFRDICDGQDPWVALGDFSHDFCGNYPDHDQRMGLVREPIGLPEQLALELRQWAEFDAASVEYLCCQSGLPVPEWVDSLFFFFNDPPPPDIYPFPLHDPLPI